MIAELLMEAAALVFVFPVLDTVVVGKQLTTPLIAVSFGIALVCFVVAVFLRYASSSEE
jgi:hypothetical protein